MLSNLRFADEVVILSDSVEKLNKMPNELNGPERETRQYINFEKMT